MYRNDFLGPRIATAVDATLCAADDDCTPYQVFTYMGVTPGQVVGLAGVGTIANETSLEMITAQVSGDLGVGLSAGNIFVAGGWEYREEDFASLSDTIYEEGMLLGQGGPTPSLAGGFTVSELFAEGTIPLLADMPAAKDLTLGLALRFSDHSVTGSDVTYRAGFDWQAIDELRVRTGYNRAVRAPNIEEMFQTQFIGLWSGVDPCATATPDYTQEQCARTGVTAAQYGNVTKSPAGQYNRLFGGNPNLEPEEADTITFGVVVDPLDSLTVSVDYWDISIDKTIDRIGGPDSPEIILDQCALNGQLCDLINRGLGGNLWVGQVGYIEHLMKNIGEQHWSGIDLAAAYRLDAFSGAWAFDLIGTYMLSKEVTPIASDPTSTYDCVGLISTKCFPAPEWRHTLTASYDSKEFWSVTGMWRFFGGVDYDGVTDEIVGDEMGAMNYFDLNAVFNFLEDHSVIVGINNVFDVEPPLVGDTMNLTHGNANAVAGFYDTLGRFFYTKVTMRF